jgi:hypothetical protein
MAKALAYMKYLRSKADPFSSGSTANYRFGLPGWMIA